MRKECQPALKPGQPALIVTYGNTTRKHYPLDHDLILLGRGAACDFTLVSPEVATIHCLIQRGRDGWLIRDCCGGRHATRLNGRPIHEEPLRDTDVVQIGTFSFEVRLPLSRATPVPGSTPAADEQVVRRLKRLQRSRQKLVRLALSWRQRGRRNQTLPPTFAELERQAESLRSLQRNYQALVQEYEGRIEELEKAEREVCDERDEFERQCAERQTRLEKAEHDLARRLAELPQMPSLAADGVASEELAHRLDIRNQELNHFARHLRRCQQQLLDAAVPSPVSNTPSNDPSPRRPRSSPLFELEHWRDQCEHLQAEWAILEGRFQQENAALKGEHTRLRGEADQLASTVKELQTITESLTREIRDRDAVLQKMRRQLEQQSAAVNLEHSGSYERELNAFRLELERDRQELNEQLCQLQSRQTEVEAAAREAEIQMARERAVIAHERAELTRMRDEIRIARERTSREGGMRERLSRIHRLKEELSGSAPSAPGEQLRNGSELITAAPPAR